MKTKVFTIFIFIILTLKSVAQCTFPISYSVNVFPPTCVGCCDGSITVTNTSGGCPPYFYQIAPGSMFSSLCPGNYTISVIDNGCCSPSSQTVTVPISTGFMNLSDKKDYVIGPNPTSGLLYILNNDYFETESRILIMNLLGQSLEELKFRKEIDVSSYPTGFYYLKIISQDKSIHLTKFIKE